MKKLILLFAIILLSFSNVYSNGVAIVNASTGIYFKLLSSNIFVSVEGQISSSIRI